MAGADVNEGYYLAKARPLLIRNGVKMIFLNSGEAHGLLSSRSSCGVSYTLHGSLGGAMAGWLVLAVGFRHAASSLLPSCMHRLFAGAVFP